MAVSKSSFRELGDAVVHVGWMAWRYLTSRDWLFAWTALMLLIAIQFGTVYVLTWGVRWQQQFFDSLEQRQAELFAQLTVVFALITLSQIALIVVNELFKQLLGLRWRVFLTDRYLGQWMARDKFYEIERRQLIDNPDQRISEDISIFTRNVPGIVLTILGQVTTAVTFTFILMETARTVNFSVLGLGLALPADLVIYAYAYALLGIAFVIQIGRPYVARHRAQQAVEADYRAGLVNVRRNAEQISFAGGHSIEQRALDRDFVAVQSNFKRLILATLGLQTGTSIYTNLSSIIPLFVLGAPLLCRTDHTGADRCRAQRVCDSERVAGVSGEQLFAYRDAGREHPASACAGGGARRRSSARYRICHRRYYARQCCSAGR